MPHRKPINPFYAAALPVGVVFAVTACAYVVMMVQSADARRAEATGLIAVLEQHGVVILVTELLLLGLLTLAAIGTDDFWTRRFEARHQMTNDN